MKKKNREEMAPIRIQRKRTRGWRMPENTVSVTRPGKWGNPFKLIANTIHLYHPQVKLYFRFYSSDYDGSHTKKDVVNLYRDLIININSHNVPPHIRNKFKNMHYDIHELKGKNLCCFCATDECHATVLLELANL